MTATVDPAIQQQYDQSAAARRTSVAEVSTELSARQQDVAAKIKADEESFAALTKRLNESTKDERPAPARRVEDNDISAKASAYQEADDEPTPPAPPAPVAAPPVITRVPTDEEEVPSFQWDEDPPAAAAPPAPEPPKPARRERPPRREDADEDLSEHDWLE